MSWRVCAGVVGLFFLCMLFFEIEPDWRTHFQLQNYDLGSEPFVSKYASDRHTQFVIEPYRDGVPEHGFTVTDIESLKSEGANRVLAYLSVGEAESYRPYWKSLPPDLLAQVNPNFPNSRSVRFWDTRWQDVIFGTEESSLSHILRLGFDGVYLDRVDAYWDFPGRATGASEMAELVLRLAQRARRVNPKFKIYIQNAPCLPRALTPELRKRFLDAVNGLSVESVFFHGSAWENNDYHPQAEPLDCTRDWLKRGLPVLALEYVTDPDKQRQALEMISAQGWSGTLTDRKLTGAFMVHTPKKPLD